MPPNRTASQETRRALDRLRALRADPEAARAFARELLRTARSPDLLLAALDTIAVAPAEHDRPDLHACYRTLAADPRRRDPGGILRARVLDILARLPSRADLDLARLACDTVERTTNGTGELLRAAGLALLARIDPESAAARAAIVLGAADAHPMSGEPALTAARVLAALHRPEPLLIVAAGRIPLPAEVQAEAIRGLTRLEPELIASLARLLLAAPGELQHLALAELLLAQEDPGPADALLPALLRSAATPELYASLAAAIVASRRTWALEAFAAALAVETQPARLALAADALLHAPPVPAAARALALLQAKLPPGSR